MYINFCSITSTLTLETEMEEKKKEKAFPFATPLVTLDNWPGEVNSVPNEEWREIVSSCNRSIARSRR